MGTGKRIKNKNIGKTDCLQAKDSPSGSSQVSCDVVAVAVLGDQFGVNGIATVFAGGFHHRFVVFGLDGWVD